MSLVFESALIVDDDEDLRETVSDVFGLAGVPRRVLAASLSEVQRQGAAALQSGLAILDVNLGEGQPTGVDVYHWLRDNGFAGTIVFLTGHAAADQRVAAAAAVPNTRVMSKPISFGDLMTLVQGPT
jgi:DNA-binding response OmpR family regulator